LGFGGGSNRGADAGNGEFILFLNADTRPDWRMLKRLVDRATAELSAGLIEATQVPVSLGKRRDAVTNYVDWCSGGVVLARRSAFDKLGGFDPLFFPTYCEDVDLSWRMWLSGWTCAVEPTAQVLNDNNPADGQLKPTEVYYTAKFSFAMRFIYDSVPGMLRHILRGLRYLFSPHTDKFRRRGVVYGFLFLFLKYPYLRMRRRQAQTLLGESGERERIVFTEWYYGRWQCESDLQKDAMGAEHSVSESNG
jgi:GT2 family glycosyltransferase